MKVIKPEKEGHVSIENIKKEESSPGEWRDMALRLIDEGNIEQAKDIALELINKGNTEQAKNIAKKLLYKEEIEYTKGIMSALRAEEYHTQELQLSLDKEDKSGQAMKSSPELKIDTGNSSSQSPQKCSMGESRILRTCLERT